MCHHGLQVAAIARPASQAAPPPMATLTRRNMPSDCSSVRKSGMEKRICKSTALAAAAFQIGGLHLLLFKQLAAASMKRDSPIDHDIAPVRQIQRVECVLLHQEYRETFLAVELLDRTEYLTRNKRRQSQRGLVQQKQTRSPHQRARD